MQIKFSIVLCMAGISLLLASTAMAAPITFNTALPVSDEEVIVRQQIHFVRASDDMGGLSRNVKTWKFITAAGYGVTNKFAVFGVLPIMSKDVRIGPASSEASGLADIKIFGRYQIYKNDGPGTTTRIAPFFGVNLPTGKTEKTSDGSTDFLAA